MRYPPLRGGAVEGLRPFGREVALHTLHTVVLFTVALLPKVQLLELLLLHRRLGRLLLRREPLLSAGDVVRLLGGRRDLDYNGISPCVLVDQKHVDLSVVGLEVDLVAPPGAATAVTGPRLRDRHLQLGPVGGLHSQQRLAVEAAADVVVGEVGQLVVGDVVKDVLDALLGPLKQQKSV